MSNRQILFCSGNLSIKPYIIGNTTLAEWHGNDQDAIQAT